MNKFRLQNKGVSMPLVIGLVMILMLASVAANELIIRTNRAVSRIEASDRAYFVAEAGIEDALYELSPHFAGYQTPDIGGSDARSNVFDSSVNWQSEWQIKSHDLFECSGDWTGYEICGRIYENQKLIVSLFNDNNGASNTSANAINTTYNVNNIGTMNGADSDYPTGFTVRFRIPDDVITANSAAFSGGLAIDNDFDHGVSTYAGPEGISGLNEDGPGDNNPNCPLSSTGRDADCDGREDEDSNQDPVIFWKLLDNLGNELLPTIGCLTGSGDASDPNGSQICEKDFGAGTYDVEIDDATFGGDGSETIQSFIQGTSNDSKLQMEFLVVAPLEQVDRTLGNRKVSIPYLEYGIYYTGNASIPNPQFVITSDGFYQDFKQTITTTVSPKTTVPLFDFTIIQQQ